VPHKEWRFLYPALPVLFTLCGIGTADLIGWLSRRFSGIDVRRLSWIVRRPLAGPVATERHPGSMRPLWLANAGTIRALDMASADPAACGLGIDPPHKWEDTGMVRMRADMRLFGAAPATAPHFNYLMATEGRPLPPDLPRRDMHGSPAGRRASASSGVPVPAASRTMS